MRIKSTTLNKIKQYLCKFFDGFTIIELMIIIAIIAIFSAVIVEWWQ